MKEKIIVISICMLFLVSAFTVSAGDESDPEIIDDEEENFDLFGPLIDNQLIQRIFVRFQIFNLEDFDAIDIVSSWIYENSQEPNYLFAAVKVKNLEYMSQRGVFTVHWRYNDKNWGVGSHIHSSGQYINCFAGEDHTSAKTQAEVNYDLENNIVTFKLAKDSVGDPQPGEVLTNTWSWACLRFTFEPLSWIFGGEMAKDYAPGLTDIGNADYGRDYTIKY